MHETLPQVKATETVAIVEEPDTIEDDNDEDLGDETESVDEGCERNLPLGIETCILLRRCRRGVSGANE